MNNIHSVLIVEDSIVQRQHLACLLEQMGIENVHEAGNGFEALNWLQTQDECPDILFCDLGMPVMDGVTMLQMVAARGYQSGVVILSGREVNLLSTVAKMAEVNGLNLLGSMEKPAQRESVFHLLSGYKRDQKAVAKKITSSVELYSLEQVADGIRKNQMLCHFQPKVSMVSRDLVGVEALVRWQHPLHSLVYPGAFIPLIENTPVMQELTLSVLNKAMNAFQYWRSHGMDFDMSVNINVSPEALANPEFAQSIADQVALHNVKPDCLVLEVTESAIIKNLAQSLATVARLRLMGFGLSIDDYGTGYSSMHQLAQLPFTELKLDRSLVNGIATNNTLQTLCESAIQMAHKLTLPVVAEGMETREDFETLREMGCDIAQGYYVAKPMPADALLAWHQSLDSFTRH